MRPECPCGYDDGGSHYHCANCGGVASAFGHFSNGKFNCPEKPIGVVSDEDMTQFMDELNRYYEEDDE